MDQVLRDLAKLTGSSVDDLESEHDRWWLYQRTMELGVGAELLLDAVAAEPDAVLATAVVVGMLEKVGAGRRPEWIGQLPPGRREFVERRATELGVAERIARGEVAGEEIPAAVVDWSDWLQLRLADSATDQSVLDTLATLGRTKRIRRTATARLSPAG